MNPNSELGKTRFEKFIMFVRETRKALWAIIGLVALFIIGFFDINVPLINPFVGERRNLLVGLIIGGIIFYIPSKWFISRFYEVDSDFIFEINANPDDGTYISVYELGDEKMDKLEFDGAQPISWRTVSGKRAYMVRELMLEENKAVTTHHAEMNDIEMMEYKNKVDEGRLRSKKWALIGMKLYARFDTIVENIEARFWSKKTDEFMEATYNAKEDVKTEVESEIPELEELKNVKKENKTDIQKIIDDAPDGIESFSMDVSNDGASSEKQKSGRKNE